MSKEFPDPLLDAKLRDVPLPEDLLARLRATALPANGSGGAYGSGRANGAEGEFDDALRDVPLPVNFASRLRTQLDDAVIDDLLGEIPVPPDLLAKLHVIPEIRPAAAWRRMALAACLMLVVGGLYGLTFGLLMNAVRPHQALAGSLSRIDLGPLSLAMPPIEMPVVRLAPPDSRPSPLILPAGESNEIAVTFIPFERRVPPGAAGELRAMLSPELKLNDDVFLMRWGGLGAPYFGDPARPDPHLVAPPRGTGIELPLVRGYDRLFWMKSGRSPPISPAAHPALRASQLALTNRTDSVELTRRLVAQNRLPDTADMRVEDFLAAVDYHFPQPRRPTLAIHTEAGPSLFAPQRHQLLQIGVQAGRVRRAHAATHLVLALDISTSMGNGDRLAIAQQAIAGLADYAGPEDHLSLVAFHHEVFPLVEAINGSDGKQLSQIFDSLRASGGDNLVGGMQQAVSVLLASGLDDQTARHLIVLTDGQHNLPPESAALAGSVLRVAAEHRITTTIVQIGGSPSDLPPGSERWDSGDASWRQARTVQEVRRELAAGLAGASTVVAIEPVIEVEFNPATVLAYRIVGHRATATTGLGAFSEATTLHDSEGATALYEVWLRPTSDDEVAWVRARWQDPRTGGRQQTSRQLVSRQQFVESIGEMAPSLQAAAVAAEIGKILSGAPDFELSAATKFQLQKKTRNFRELAAACQNLNPSLESWEDFLDLMELVASLENVRRRQTP